MNVLKLKSLIWLMAGVLVFSACKDDDTEDPTLAVSSITTTDGTDLYGATSATTVGTDQNILIGFSGTINGSTLGNVKLKNGDNTVASSVTASGSTVTIDPTEPLFGGTVYTVQINGVQSTDGATSGNVSTSFTTAGIGLGTAPQAGNQRMYLQLNGNVVDVTGNAAAGFTQVSYTTDRFGNENSAAYFGGSFGAPGTGDIVELSGDNFLFPSMTYSLWVKIDHADYPEGQSKRVFGIGVERGYFLELGDNGVAWMKVATSHEVSPDPANISFATSWSDNINGGGNTDDLTLVNYTGSISNDIMTSNDWHQIIMSYNAETTMKSIYVDGTLIAQYNLSWNSDPTFEYNMKDMAFNDLSGIEPVVGLDKTLALGFTSSRANTATGWSIYTNEQNTYKGSMDDFRIWNVALTPEQASGLYTAEKP
ncbi:hypothetical protein G3O08_13905 [Cryomorpha ignava]|uniref:SbsA Ig-like domain-containing protein n=1 Tax=Cryomorpha ignava TaxID=101383 RepID=A0A7K3WSU1_9FLAO|nr:Ig-like domain-containing protein [Cryomorpha ignava]NEN24598.1 hypothetical protein [Cryomorpha ignava]